MIRECDFMMRRLRKVQSRQMGRHVSEEVHGTLEYSQQLIRRKERETKSISTMTPINQLQSDKHKGASNSMRALLKRIDHVATNQQITHVTVPSPNDIGGPVDSKPNFHRTIPSVVPRFDQNGIHQLHQVTGYLGTELKLIESAFDSEATASSSGGESADEMVSYNNIKQQPLTM